MTEMMNVAELASEADEELLARYQQCDDDTAFTMLHDRHREELLAYAIGHLDMALRADAEDIVQQTFMHFHINRKRYAPKSCVRALLYKMLEDYRLEYLRQTGAEKRNRTRTYPLYERHSDSRDESQQDSRENRKKDALIDPETDQQKLRIQVDEMLATLTPKQAEAIRLTKIDGHTAESAAKLLDVQPTAIHKRVKDGMNVLKRRAAANG